MMVLFGLLTLAVTDHGSCCCRSASVRLFFGGVFCPFQFPLSVAMKAPKLFAKKASWKDSKPAPRLGELIAQLDDHLREYRTINGKRSPRAQDWWTVARQLLMVTYGGDSPVFRSTSAWRRMQSNVPGPWLHWTITCVMFVLLLLTYF